MSSRAWIESLSDNDRACRAVQAYTRARLREGRMHAAISQAMTDFFAGTVTEAEAVAQLRALNDQLNTEAIQDSSRLYCQPKEGDRAMDSD